MGILKGFIPKIPESAKPLDKPLPGLLPPEQLPSVGKVVRGAVGPSTPILWDAGLMKPCQESDRIQAPAIKGEGRDPKPRLGLFFGHHGSEIVVRGKPKRLDKVFTEIEPFLLRCAAEGRKCAAIFETVVAMPFRTGDDFHAANGMTRILKAEAEGKFHAFEKQCNGDLADMCMRGPSDGFSEQTGWRNWKLGGAEKKLNDEKPGSLMIYMEPQHAEIVYAYWKSGLLRKMIKAEPDPDLAFPLKVEYLINRLRGHLMRDAGVARLAKKLMDEDSSMAVVIPRGTGHRGMHQLFDRSKYDLEIFDSGLLHYFEHDALEIGYRRPITEGEIRSFAKLEFASGGLQSLMNKMDTKRWISVLNELKGQCSSPQPDNQPLIDIEPWFATVEGLRMGYVDRERVRDTLACRMEAIQKVDGG